MTEEAINKYAMLCRRAERIIQRPHQYSHDSLRRLRNSIVEWLQEQLPDSGLRDQMLGVFIQGGSANRAAGAQRCLKILSRAKELLPFLREDDAPKLPKPENTRKVFVVHGHDEALKNAVARLLERLELQPIILHEQPNKGRTIIEKFLDYSDVAFAVVLLTPDDVGGLVTSASSEFRPRARQNVVLELGLFLGRLTRQRVAALYVSGVDLPSDYTGVLFIPHDDVGAWQLQLAKELEAAGVKIDLNRI